MLDIQVQLARPLGNSTLHLTSAWYVANLSVPIPPYALQIAVQDADKHHGVEFIVSSLVSRLLQMRDFAKLLGLGDDKMRQV